MVNLIFQIYIDDIPQRKHLKYPSLGSGRVLGLKKNFTRYAQKYGFTEVINDDASWLEYSYKDDTGRVMSLQFVKDELMEQ